MEIAGLLPASQWGAAIGASYETLRGHRYITNSGMMTVDGWAALCRHLYMELNNART